MRKTHSATAGLEEIEGQSPGMQATSRSWKRLETNTALEPPEGTSPAGSP
jgi:hypothetical protein